MTDETFRTIFVAAVTAVPPTLVALAALIQGMRNGVKADTAAKKAAAAEGKATDVSLKADEIHETTQAIRRQTDGINSKLSADNAALQAMVASLEKQVVALTTAMTPREAAKIPPEQIVGIVERHPELDRRRGNGGRIDGSREERKDPDWKEDRK